MSAAYGKTVGGKLRLKAPGAGASAAAAPSSGGGAAAAPSRGTKRPRSPPREAHAYPGGPDAPTAAAAAPAQEASRTLGTGRLISSGTTLHGKESKFAAELKVGDAIELINPATGAEEIRIIKMVLSDASAGINAPFGADVMTATPFHILRLARAADDPRALAEIAKADANAAERSAFGTYAGDGGTTFTYRVRKPGVYGGYQIVSEKTTGGAALSREALLDARSKFKSDKFC